MNKSLAALRLIVVSGLLVALVVASVVVLRPFAAGVADAVSTEPPDLDLELLDDFATRSYVYAADESPLATLVGPENRQPVPLDVVPNEVVEAILAVEDAEFWNHGGVNVRAMARALFRNVDTGGVAEGGSTITQQLVKNAYLTSDTTFSRKSREAVLALELERQLSKEEILETYLNAVYFGAGAYGVQAAAETYWGVWVNELGWGEAALLAGLISNPGRFDPFTNPEGARRQRSLALGRLVDVGLITADEAETFDAAPLPTNPCLGDNPPSLPICDVDLLAPSTGNYFVEDVRQALLSDPVYGLGDTAEERAAKLYGGGLRIHTTLDPGLQQKAESAVDEVVPDNPLGVTAAMVAVENESGAVRAMVGGGDYSEDRYNVASQLPGRQTGSTFKTFVLLAALNQGGVPLDSVQGGGSFPNPGGTPNPYQVTGSGGTLTSITASSSNGAYIRLGQIVGLEDVGVVAERLGLRTDFGDYPISLPLGTLLTAPLDMASAFSAIANEGVRNPAYMIERVVDADGEVLFEHQPRPTRALTRQVACLATEVLRSVVEGGTATRARLPNQPVAGKTGTTERNADAWFVGFTPYVTTAVWMGNPEANVSMANLGGVANFGGTFPAMVWRAFNAEYHAELDVRRFPSCDSVRSGRSITEERGFDLAGTWSQSSQTWSGSGSATTSTTRPGEGDDGDDGEDADGDGDGGTGDDDGEVTNPGRPSRPSRPRPDGPSNDDPAPRPTTPPTTTPTPRPTTPPTTAPPPPPTTAPPPPTTAPPPPPTAPPPPPPPPPTTVAD